jgi:hypothetical protein
MKLPDQLSFQQVTEALASLGIPAPDELDRLEMTAKGIRVTYMRRTNKGLPFVYGDDVARETYEIGWIYEKEGE